MKSSASVSFDDLVRQLAHQIWQTRGCPHGSDQQDWFAALAIVNALTDARSNAPAEFFHCFTRPNERKTADENLRDAFDTLKLMLDMGILLTPEQLSFNKQGPVTQSRLSLAFIHPHELFLHSKKFGPFALRMQPYEAMVGVFGASPVWYIPSVLKEGFDSDLFEHGTELFAGLARLQHWLEEMEHDPARSEQRHEPHRTSRLVARLLYPTHYEPSTKIRDIYYMQREWRIIRRESDLDKLANLNEGEKSNLMKHNARFFGGKVTVWSESDKARVDQPRIDATWKLNAKFSEVVSEILVPNIMVDAVRALNPGVPVGRSDQYCYGFHE